MLSWLQLPVSEPACRSSVTVGGLRSIVTSGVELAEAGPLLPAVSEAPSWAKVRSEARRVGTVRSTGRLAPEPDRMAIVQELAALPVLEKSPVATPVTASLKLTS